MRSKIESIIQHAKIQGSALYFAYKDNRTPWFARLVSALVIVQIFNPIDIIPDFIPVLGYLDDLILVPAGLWLAWRLIPPVVKQQSLDLAREMIYSNPAMPKKYGQMIIAGWIIFVIIVGMVIYFLFINPKTG
jgi:uncharacterized membrane protein YkvA (DUF1232 family)